MSRVKLGDVAREHKETIKGDKSNYPIVGLEHLIPENIRLTQCDYNKENTFTKVFRKGCVLFGRRRAYLKKAVYADFDGICSGDITVIEAIPGKILPELLPFVIQNDDLFDYAVGKSAGSLSPRVKWEHLKNYEFELPDIEKQHELAQILWSIVKTKESYERLMAATDELVKSQFIELIGDNPEYKELSMFGTIGTGTTPSMKIKEYYENRDIPFIKPSDMPECGVVELYDSEYHLDNRAKSVARMIDGGSLLVTCIGSIGKMVITGNKCTCNQQINYLIPNDDTSILYVAHALNAKRQELIDYAKAPVVPIINKSDFSKFKIAYVPYKKQLEFANYVRQSDKSKFELENCIKNAVSMYKKILKEYLG